MILTKHIKKRFFLTAILLLAGFLVSSEALAAGMSVGNSTLNLGAGENIYYGVTSATNTNGNFLLLEKGYGNTVFKIDYNGNITTNGNLTGANSYWSGSGNNLFAATTYNVGIGTADAGAYKLNVNGNTNITGNLNVTGSLSSGGITGLTIAAPNVASGAFAANTGGGNFSFPANVGVGITTPVTNGGAASAMIHLNSAANTWSVFHSTNSTTGAAAGDGTIFGTIGNDAYIYNYEAGNLNFNTNGSTGSMVLNSAGNLGIGTNNPGYRLVVGAGSTNEALSIYGGSTSASSLYFSDASSGTGSYEGIIDYFHSSNKMQFGTNHTYQMTIDNAGNVGIGTTNPGAMLHLKVNGSKPYLALETSGDNDLWALSPKNSYDLGLDSYWEGIAGGITTANVMYFKNDGNVGIGTAAPGAYKLYVNGNTNINGTLTATGITGVTVNAANVSAGAFAANTGGGNFSFSGSLGIGTTNPVTKLHVTGAGNTTGGNIHMGDNTDGTAKWTFLTGAHYNGASYPTGISLIGSYSTASDNNVVIGGNIYEAKAATNIQFWTDTTTVSTAGGSEKMRILGNGNVGIGITDPGAYKLYVNGSTNINGTLNATTYTGGSMTGTVNAANVSAGTFGTNTGGGAYSFGGATTNGVSHYQFDGGTYRNPGDYSPMLNIRQDNATAGVDGFKPALSLYNSNGSVNTTVGLDFISAEASGSTGNTVTLAGIMAIKELAGVNGGWTQGGLLFYTKNMGTRVDALRILNNGNVGIGTDPGTYKLNVNGTVNIANTLTARGGAAIMGTLVMDGTTSANITGINKISVNTVDPLYNIHGTNYASFAASVVGGVKEEVTGKVTIENKVGSEYETVINFDKETIGSDLWVWHNVVDFNKDNVEALITPYGGFANTYYYISGNSIIFKSDRPTEISYRLIAKRFDWKKWPTLPADQTEKAGLIIK